jgi:hypothetical protein
MPELDMPLNKMEESIKLYKNVKSYTWEIKIFLHNGPDDNKCLERLEELNNECLKRFGSIM